MSRILATVSMFLVCAGFVFSDEFSASITKVDGNKITLTKLKKGEKGEETTLTAADGVKVLKGKFNPETKKFEAGDAIENGLKNEIFSKEVRGRVITNDEGKITEIRVGGRKKKTS